MTQDNGNLTPDSITQWLTRNERTVSWLARHCDVSPSFMWRILKGQRGMPDDLQRRIAEVIAANSCRGDTQ